MSELLPSYLGIELLKSDRLHIVNSCEKYNRTGCRFHPFQTKTSLSSVTLNQSSKKLVFEVP